MKAIRLLMFCSFILVLTACGEQGTPTDTAPIDNQAASKKLIDLSGYNLPYADILLNSIPAMKERGYAGSAFKLRGLWADVFVNSNDPEHLYKETDFTANYPVLRQIKASGYTENFLLVYSQTSAGWSWLSNSDWTSAEAKLRGFAKAAKEAGAPGLLFDTEPYGFSPWRYDQAYYQGKTLEEVSQVVRERGKRFIQVVQSELPNAKILSLWLMIPILEQWEQYALIKPFFEGMLEAALPTIQFIDGNELSYYFLTADEFDTSKTRLRDAYSVLDPSLKSKYQQQLKVAHAVYLDGVMNTWNSPRFFGYYLANNVERLRLFRHNVYHGLRSTDEYVWIYNENMNYYENKIPTGLLTSLKLGLTRFRNNQPLRFSITEFVAKASLEFDRKISVSGNIQTKVQNSGVDILSGFVDEYGDESACIVYDAYGNYDCTFPYGTSVTLTPTLAGATFTPNQLNLGNLTQNLGDQNFTQR